MDESGPNMKISCQFCVFPKLTIFKTFEAYRDHIKSQHTQDTNLNIKLEHVTLATEYKCKKCEFSWIYKNVNVKQETLILYMIDGERYCVDCKTKAINKIRITKFYKNYCEAVESLDDIAHPELWIPVEKINYSCCCCSKRNPAAFKLTQLYSFFKWPEHLFCAECFQNIKSAVKRPDWDPYTFCECGYGYYLKTK